MWARHGAAAVQAGDARVLPSWGTVQQLMAVVQDQRPCGGRPEWVRQFGKKVDSAVVVLLEFKALGKGRGSCRLWLQCVSLVAAVCKPCGCSV